MPSKSEFRWADLCGGILLAAPMRLLVGYIPMQVGVFPWTSLDNNIVPAILKALIIFPPIYLWISNRWLRAAAAAMGVGAVSTVLIVIGGAKYTSGGELSFLGLLGFIVWGSSAFLAVWLANALVQAFGTKAASRKAPRFD